MPGYVPPTDAPQLAVDPDHDWALIIDGERVAPGSGTYEIVDPNTTAVIGHAPEATVAQSADAAAAAKAALPAWKSMPYEGRCALLSTVADRLEKLAPTWIDLIQAETGATLKIAGSLQIGNLINRFRDYSRPVPLTETLEATPIERGPLGPAGLMSAQVLRQPVGVVTTITSYNFPLVNTAGKVAPALAMGNTCVIKPAPQDPLAVLLFGEVLAELLPPGVANVVTGSTSAVPETLVDSDDVDMVSFTGSSPVGTRIYETGARTMKRMLMELGGKGALIMTDDCDLGSAVGGIATTWGFHSGQICTAPTRVICHESIYDQTVEQLAAVSGFLTVGDARAKGTLVGPVITDTHRDRVEAFVAAGVEAGATLVSGGERPDFDGWFVAPTLLADCTADMHVVREEAFGPVVVIMKCADDDEAVALANDSDYGLYSYVYAGDTARAYEIGRRLETGNVGINVIQPHLGAPFGGFKRSGIGRDRGIHGLYAYSELQAINWLG